MGALQLYQKACLDHQLTWQMYREALTLGGTRRLSELFQAAGADFPLRPGVVKSVVGFLATQLQMKLALKLSSQKAAVHHLQCLRYLANFAYVQIPNADEYLPSDEKNSQSEQDRRACIVTARCSTQWAHDQVDC